MISTTITPQIGQAMAQLIKRGNEKRRKRLALFYKTINAVTRQADWDNIETVTLAESTLRGRPAKVYIRNIGMVLQLHLDWQDQSGSWHTSPPFAVGVMVPAIGQAIGQWKVTYNANEANYLRWNKQVIKTIDQEVAE